MSEDEKNDAFQKFRDAIRKKDRQRSQFTITKGFRLHEKNDDTEASSFSAKDLRNVKDPTDGRDLDDTAVDDRDGRAD